MPPQGHTNAKKGKAAAAADAKQAKLGFSWKLAAASPRTHLFSSLPEVSPLTPTPKRLKPSPPPPQVDNWDAVLQVRATVNSLLDRVIYIHERDANAVDVECRNTLNAAIDFVILQSTQQPTMSTTLDLKWKRMQYTPGQRVQVVKLLAEASSSGSMAATGVQRLNRVPGYEKVTTTMVAKWARHGPKKKTGRKVNSSFETQVISQFIYTEFEIVNGIEIALIKANVAHSYGVMMAAARVVQAMPQFAGDPKVAKLQFSRKWVVGFLRRATLRRRRITAEDKSLPPVGQVRSRMAEIQSTLTSGAFLPDEVINANETGVFFGAQP